ncbi:MAG: glycerol-3-phosphate dehydrogenase [Proteobacteria bacterium]|nr:glycerol-3-phosphate dehydrogenase [Pseudomonadota bacterium]
MDSVKGENRALMFSPETRDRNIHRMGQETFDLLVVGGGITGAGIVRDAALRGFKTALIEKDDFAIGTSSRSSKLVHGGFRYLAQFHFGMVREALVERKILTGLAPHIVYPLECLLPVYRGSMLTALQIRIGMWLYDFLAFGKNIGKHRMISAGELDRVEPEYRQEGLQKGAQYYDCWTDDFRLVMATVLSAAQHGAVIVNHVKAVDAIVEKGRVLRVLAKDQLRDEEIAITSRVVVNATGPWSDLVRDALVRQENRRLRLTKGVHLIVSMDDLPIRHALMQFAIQDNRPIFAIPWRNFVLLGTTDTDYDGDPDRIGVERSDVDYLLESFNFYFPKANLTDNHVISAFAGLRPLIFQEGKSESQVSREYQIFEGPENFFSIIGGKLTTYRKMAEKMVDRVARRLAGSFQVGTDTPKCITAEIPLFGGEIKDRDQFERTWVSRLTSEQPVDRETAAHFVETYGANIPVLLRAIEKTPEGMDRIHSHLPYVWGELTYAIDHEMALTLDDFLTRRTHIFSLARDQGADLCKAVADRMQERLGWSAEEKQTQIDRFRAGIRLTRHFHDTVQ